ncbi:MAG: TGS domain-containing protein [Vicinamibacterales bacterium]
MSQVNVTLPDGSSRAVPAGTSVRDVAEAISPRLAKAALAGIVDGRLVDLSFPLNADAAVKIVTQDSPEALHVYRHSTAHLLAAAVTNLFPDVQCGIGPATDEGFFYDFVVPVRSCPRISRSSRTRCASSPIRISIYERQMWPRDDAKAFFAGRGEPLKVQLIDEKTEGQSEVSCYTIKDKETFIDFCVGPHVPTTGKLKAFKLLSTSNAYWKGDARNQPMQRVYGTAFFSDKDLKAYLTQRRGSQEARPSQAREKSSASSRSTSGHPVPRSGSTKGRRLYNLLAGYMREVLFPAGYVEVKTPIIFNKGLWETSGHWSHYRENMFLVEVVR